MVDDANKPERPRAEPEIIPPARGARPPGWRTPPWDDGFGDMRATRRVYVRRVGPFGIALLLLAVAAIVAILMIAAVGVVLIWIPIVAAVIIAGAALRLLRRFGAR